MEEKEYLEKYTHEMKNLLSGIYGYSDFIRQGLVDEKMMRLMNEKIHKLSAQATELAEKSMLYEMLKKNLYPMQEEVFSVLEILQEIREEAEKDGVWFERVLYMGGTQTLRGDRYLCERMLYHLLQNAGRYGKGEEEILLSIAQEGSYQKIMVCNPVAERKEIQGEELFEPFYRMNKQESRKIGGHGLGLAIVSEIVEKSGGKRKVECSHDLFAVTVLWKG